MRDCTFSVPAPMNHFVESCLEERIGISEISNSNCRISRLADFESEFYPLYLCEHQRPGSRLLHFVADCNCAALALAWWRGGYLEGGGGGGAVPWWAALLAAAAQGAALSLAAHRGVEGNRPMAGVRHPVWVEKILHFSWKFESGRRF